MTSTFMRPAIALALALGLAGCGGKASFPITGTIVGLSYPGLVLATNGMELAVAPGAIGTNGPAAVSFTFPNTLSYGEVYNVETKHDPDHQTCTVASFLGPNNVVLTGASDTAGRLSTINIGVSCVVKSQTVSVHVTGLTVPATATSLQLTNGSTGGTITATADGTFALPVLVEFGKTYGVTVLTQPTGQVCTVASNGTGTMGEANVTVEVACGAP